MLQQPKETHSSYYAIFLSWLQQAAEYGGCSQIIVVVNPKIYRRRLKYSNKMIIFFHAMLLMQTIKTPIHYTMANMNNSLRILDEVLIFFDMQCFTIISKQISIVLSFWKRLTNKTNMVPFGSM